MDFSDMKFEIQKCIFWTEYPVNLNFTFQTYSKFQKKREQNWKLNWSEYFGKTILRIKPNFSFKKAIF